MVVVRKTRRKLVATGLLLSVPVFFLVLLGVKTLGVYSVSQTEASQQTARLQAQSSALQAFAAIAGVFVALVLAGITYWYARLTKGILEKTGPIVSVELGIARYGDDPSTGFVATPFDCPTPSPTEIFSNRQILVKVLNAGNGSVMIEGVALGLGNGKWYPVINQRWGVQLPHKLEGNSSANFLIELETLLSAIKALKDKTLRTVHAEIELGNGQTVHSAEESVRVS